MRRELERKVEVSLAPTTVDFETKPIKARPEYPPEPVGVALWTPGKRPEYLSWGHAGGGNNSTKAKAAKRLRVEWRSNRRLLFHNAKFDLDVAETFFDLTLPTADRWLDSMFEAFLYDPNEQDLQLKSLAHSHLGMPPDEQDDVRDWLYAHIKGMKRRKKAWAAHIWLAPGNVVAPYAKGDVIRTRKLHDYFMPWILEAGMEEAYLRERRLMPILLGMERRGVPVDAKRLSDQIVRWEASQEVADKWIRRRLKSRDLNVDSNVDLADAIELRGKVKRDDEGELMWLTTATGKRSVSKDSIDQAVSDVELRSVLSYRASLGHSLRTNARNWLEMAEADGRIYCNWNQVRQSASGKQVGARTGRLSSSPNAQNIGNAPLIICWSAAESVKILAADDEAKTMLLPSSLRGKVEPLPWMRDFVAAKRGRILLARDYAQQELRILAHFMEGAVLEIYRRNPFRDFHQMATNGLNQLLGLVGVEGYKRKLVKAIVLAIIYARGIPALAAQLNIEEDEARKLRRTIRKLFPGVEDMERALRRRGALEQPVTTWGGRVFFCEPPKMIDGKLRTFEYKMINTLVQGSAADNTKEAMIRYDETKKNGEMVLQVHDELLCDVPKRAARSEMLLLREAMESVEFDVPMMTDGEIGPTWGQMEEFNDRRSAALRKLQHEAKEEVRLAS